MSEAIKGKLLIMQEEPVINGLYQQLNKKRMWRLVIICLFLTASLGLDVSIGSSWMNLFEIFNALISGPGSNSVNTTIVWQLRLPLTLTCMMVGACLGLAGGLMQTLLANPLASPYTLGVSAAAGFGAAVAILSGVTILGNTWLGVPIAAFIAAGLSSLAIYFIGKRQNMDAKVLVLAGIVILFFFQALLSLAQYLASPEVLQQIVFWLFGSLLKANWVSVGVAGIILLISIIWIYPKVWVLTALSSGDEQAQALGINTSKIRLQVFLLCSLLTTGAVSFVGTIGFIGLVAPHLSRMLVGEDQRFYLPAATLIGALLLTSASLVSKVIIPGAIIPIGIITSLVGVPFLLYLLVSRRFNQ
ncbi:FecCD family ABC transporter permease [Spartinivicinus poritis]|uniref:Iron ABC transporter permease n=1 Tax=Spartinivicinus poritis TaxID=2994640 RepID=A0ABT5UBE1_9GAMM|nr:iron ABC transporter permease [Spartinivicinus sp. A2-2]MDE1463687.1 iron ABC transporter permease [Spartinivicinus sp. A2-2]